IRVTQQLESIGQAKKSPHPHPWYKYVFNRRYLSSRHHVMLQALRLKALGASFTQRQRTDARIGRQGASAAEGTCWAQLEWARGPAARRCPAAFPPRDAGSRPAARPGLWAAERSPSSSSRWLSPSTSGGSGAGSPPALSRSSARRRPVSVPPEIHPELAAP